ncbi:hypothetical protein JMA_14690 [Jeotgalibacillus malaysiensis]|uniref:Uncharacterized protein n=1 Tax=Jeotgalibacillus malaysiensis TaxID=1508404 RepID=A0A0B5AL12_9BACL|nr:hypothetical protein [Jeotgalibacillus malaysiensis]AJD90786.1 hypothetical protein JMA_14690 [Jeotgalibacillus malaysiensis]
MLSRELSQTDFTQTSHGQSLSELQSERLLKYISEFAMILNPDGIILNFNEQSKCQFHPEVGASISRYLKSEHLGWLKACMLGENRDTANLQFFNGSCIKECKGECIPLTGGEAYLFILSDIHKVQDEIIYANVFARAIHGLLITDNQGILSNQI